MEQKIKIAVHGGSFHPDDCFSCAFLSLLYENSEIIRTTNPEIIESCDFKVDVGFKYDHEKKCYDHHQLSFTKARESGIKFSSFGILWNHYGSEFIKKFSNINEQLLEKVRSRIDKILVEPVDAMDNGISCYELKDSCRSNDIRKFDIDDLIECLHPIEETPENLNKQFFIAMDICKQVLKNLLQHAIAFIKNKELINDSILEGLKKKARYIELKKSLPYHEQLFYAKPEELFQNPTREEIAGCEKFLDELLYVIYPKMRGENIQWYLECVPRKFGEYENRKSLPMSWGGKQGDELVELTGVQGTLFCHKALFLCSAKTREDIYKLLELALNN